MWQDMGIYWAWRGKSSVNDPPPPSERTLKYATVEAGGIKYKLAIEQTDVWQDDSVTTKAIHQEEVDRLKSYGCVVEEVYE